MAELEIEDPRALFIANYVLKITNQKPEKFTKAYLMEDTMKLYNDFFEGAKKRTLFVCLGPSGSFITQATWPGIHKTKGCYFVKKKTGRISMETNMCNFLIYGDMSPTPIEQFSLLVDEVRLRQLYQNQHERKMKNMRCGAGCKRRTRRRSSRIRRMNE